MIVISYIINTISNVINVIILISNNNKLIITNGSTAIWVALEKNNYCTICYRLVTLWNACH